MTNFIAPAILCCEDMQNYDALTFNVLKSIIKNYNRLFVIGMVRD